MATSLGAATLYLDLDAKDLMRQLRALEDRIKQVEQQPHKVKVEADTSQAERGLNSLLDRLNGLRGSSGGAGGFLAGLAQQFGGPGGGGGLAASIGVATAAMGQLGMAITGVQQVAGLLSQTFQQAYGALNQFAQQAGEFNKTVLSASTTTAMFNRVFVDGFEVKGAADKIKAARPAILKELQQLQKDAMYINGATTQQLTQMFSIVMQNNGTNGDLGKARRLTASMAAGLNTFGIPGWQAEQEIRAILTGDIDMNARLAKNINVSRADIERAKGKGQLFEYLQEKLAPAIAGQQLGSDTLENVQSNIQDAFERIGNAIGQPIEKALKDAFKRAFEAIAGGADMFGQFGARIADVLGPVLVIFGDITAALVNLGRIAIAIADPILAIAQPFLKIAGLGLEAIFYGIAKGLEGVANIFEGVGGFVSAFIDVIAGPFNKLIDGAIAKIKFFFDAFVTGTKLFKDFMLKAADDVRRTLGNEKDPNTRLETSDLGSSAKSVLEQAQKLVQSEFEFRKTELQEYSKLEQQVGKVTVERQQNILKALEGQKQVLQAVFDLENRRAQLQMTIAQGRVQAAGTEEEKARRQNEADALAYQQKERQYQQGVAVLEKERSIQEQQLRIQRLTLELKKKELETTVTIAKLELDRSVAALREAMEKNRPASEKVALNAQVDINRARLDGAKAQLAVIGEQTRALGIQAQTQRDLNGLQQQGLAVQLQIDATQYRNQQTQAAIAKANRERNQRQQQLEATLKRQTEAINNQIAALQRQLDLERQSTALAEARERLEKTRGEGEIGRLEKIQQLLRERDGADAARRQVIDAQLRILGAERDQVAVAERLRELKLDLIEKERRAAIAQVDRKERELEIQEKIAKLQLAVSAAQAYAGLVSAAATNDSNLMKAKLDGNTKAEAGFTRIGKDLQVQSSATQKFFLEQMAAYGDREAVEKLLGLYGLPSLATLNQGANFKTQGMDLTRNPQAAQNTIVPTGGAVGRGSAERGGFGTFTALAQEQGLVVTSAYRANSNSYHGTGQARDYGGSSDNMLRFAKMMAEQFGTQLEELIFTPLGFGIKNGKQVPLSFWGDRTNAGHNDHVHVAFTGALQPSAAARPGSGTTPGTRMPFPLAATSTATGAQAGQNAAQSAAEVLRGIADQLDAGNKQRNEQRQGFAIELDTINAQYGSRGLLENADTTGNVVESYQLRAFERFRNGVAEGFGALFDVFRGNLAGAITGVVDLGRTLQQTLSDVLMKLGTDLLEYALKPLREGLVNLVMDVFNSMRQQGGGGGGILGSILGIVTGAFSLGAGAFGSTSFGGFDAMAGAGGGFGSYAGSTTGDWGVSAFGFANGGVIPGGFRAFATGGIVSQPTLGLVGEGQFNEAVVPLPDGRRIPVELRGSSGGGARDYMEGRGSGASSPILNMQFETVQIMGEEYVSRQQLEQAMAETRRQAAAEGARSGMSMTLNKLQQSPQTRRRIGI